MPDDEAVDAILTRLTMDMVEQIARRTISSTQERVRVWAAPIFTKSTSMSTALHMRKEVDEVIAAIEKGDVENLEEELADVLHMVFHCANTSGINLGDAFEKKFACNQQRTWLPPNEQGIVYHDPEGGD